MIAASAMVLGYPAASRADIVDKETHDAEAQTDMTAPFTPVSERRFGLGTASMYLRYAHALDPRAVSGLSDMVMAGLSTRASYGKRIGYGVGLGLELGGAGAPGFAYGFELYPAGMTLALGPTGYLGVFLGVGVNGVTARIPASLVMPAELRLEIDFTRHARLGALFGVAWNPGQEARQGGSTLVPFADETLMAISARFGKTFPRYNANMGRGYFFRIERREQMKTALFGLTFGVEIDAAN